MKRKYVVSPQDLILILSGLHRLSDECYRENQIGKAREVSDLILSLKKECNWNKEDEEKLL